jgi:predicted amidohydrolase
MSETKLAAANIAIEHDKRKNLTRFLEWIDEAASKGVNLLVFPEVGLQGYADFGLQSGQPEYAEQRKYYLHESEPIPGPATEAIQRAVQRTGMYVQLGMAEKALHGNLIYNSTALIGPEGVVGVFRKAHASWDYPWFNPGESAPVFDTRLGRLASLICYDACFPEFTRVYALQGAEVLVMSTAWPMLGHDRENDFHGQALDLITRATAFFNQVWLVVSNHCEQDAYSTHHDYFGGSQIVDPGGRVVAYVGAEEGMAIATVDIEEGIWAVRTRDFAECNLLQDRRPELYAAVLDDSFKYPHPGSLEHSESLPNRNGGQRGANEFDGDDYSAIREHNFRASKQ